MMRFITNKLYRFQRIKDKYRHNFCIEDSRLDRSLLHINPQDNIYMITCATDNVLEYLLDRPNSIHCVSDDPHQNHLLELKITCMKILNQSDFFQLFVKNNSKIFKRYYREINERLSCDVPHFSGAMSNQHCPEYMKQENYELVKAQLHKIKIHSGFFEECIAHVAEPGYFTKVILANHMDALDEGSIQKCWSNFKKYASPHAQYLWRSREKEMNIECLRELNFLGSHGRETKSVSPVEPIDMSGSVHCAQIPAPLIFNDNLAPKVFERSLWEDAKTQFNMLKYAFMKKDDEFMDHYYRKQAKHYDNYRSRMLHGKVQLMNKLTFKSGMTVLVQGVGTGEILDTLEHVIPSLKELVLIDIADVMLEQCRERVKNKGWTHVHIEHADAALYVKPEYYDLVICSYVLTMIQDWNAVLHNTQLSLKHGGIYAVTDFTNDKKQSFLKWVFKLNHVFLNSEHFLKLKQMFHQRYFVIKKGGFPIIIKWIRCAYYVGLFEKR